jgi:adenylylsulfate kinase
MEKKTMSAPMSREEKEARLNQRAKAIWLYGLSGAGKTTLATALEARLAADGFKTVLLDGDAIRSGLNRGLGFSEADRTENIRRAAEVAKLFVGAGIIPICAFITPLESHRELIRKIIGPADLIDVYLAASYAACAQRDPKGLYRRAEKRQVMQFTGLDSAFDPPNSPAPNLILDTANATPETCLEKLYNSALARARKA